MNFPFRSFIAVIFILCASLLAPAADAQTLRLWPKDAPGDTVGLAPEKDTTTAKDDLVAGKRLQRITNIANPILTVYRPPAAKETGAAVLVFPGGGYRILAYDLEGSEVCDWLNSIGITAILVKYRVPATQDSPRRAAPLQDAQRAVGIVRNNAKAWHIDPARIGVLGFSAGAHLAVNISNNFETRTYPAIDAADSVSCRPDFSVIIYPAYLTDKDLSQINPDLHVTHNTPPTFLLQAEDDSVHVENTLVYFIALHKANVPAEMHVFAQGGHGYGLRHTAKPVTDWPLLAEKWFHTEGILAGK